MWWWFVFKTERIQLVLDTPSIYANWKKVEVHTSGSRLSPLLIRTNNKEIINFETLMKPTILLFCDHANNCMHISSRKLNLNQIIMCILFEMPLHFALKCQTATRRVLLRFLLDLLPSATIQNWLSLPCFFHLLPSFLLSPSIFLRWIYEQTFVHLVGQRHVYCIKLPGKQCCLMDNIFEK